MIENGEWKNVWPKLSKGVNIRESIVDVDEIVKLTNETALDNIKAQNIEELLQVVTGESLSKDNLNELVEQKFHDDDEQKKLSTHFLKKEVQPL